MSLPGVESARRRRASHGRSAAFEPHIRLTKPVAATSAVLEGDSSHSRAMAARHRLDEKLRVIAPCRSTTRASSSSSPAPIRAGTSAISLSTDNGLQQRASISTQVKRESHERCREFGLREERMETMGGGAQEDCPVCLDSFVSGQMVMYLPCHHRFHSTCLVPWLLSHCHCPFCRAHVANPHDW